MGRLEQSSSRYKRNSNSSSSTSSAPKKQRDYGYSSANQTQSYGSSSRDHSSSSYFNPTSYLGSSSTPYGTSSSYLSSSSYTSTGFSDQSQSYGYGNQSSVGSAGGYNYLSSNWLDSVRPNFSSSSSSRGGDFYGQPEMASFGYAASQPHSSPFSSTPRDSEEAELMQKIQRLQSQIDSMEGKSGSGSSRRSPSRDREKDSYSSATRYSGSSRSQVSYPSAREGRGSSRSRDSGRGYRGGDRRGDYASSRDYSAQYRSDSGSRTSSIPSLMDVKVRPPRPERKLAASQSRRGGRSDRDGGTRYDAASSKMEESRFKRPRAPQRGGSRDRGAGRAEKVYRTPPVPKPRLNRLKRKVIRTKLGLTGRVPIEELEEISDAEDETSKRPPSPRTCLVMTSLREFSSDPYLPEECVNLVKREVRELEQSKTVETEDTVKEAETPNEEIVVKEGEEAEKKEEAEAAEEIQVDDFELDEIIMNQFRNSLGNEPSDELLSGGAEKELPVLQEDLSARLAESFKDFVVGV